MRLLLLSLVLLPACSMFGPSANMSTEQLKAVAADKNANALCLVAPTPWGSAKTVLLSLDKSAIAGGAVSSESNCDKVSITAEQKTAVPKEPTK